jgi:hypothetical protein
MNQPTFDFNAPEQPKIDGLTYVAGFDAERLKGQAKRTYSVMSDERWYTLSELQQIILVRFGVSDSQTGLSARIRDMRKKSRGSHRVNSRRRGDPKAGVWEYQLEVKR